MPYDVDPNRVAFVQREYLYELRSDATVKSRYPAAIDIEIATQLDQPAAAQMADQYFTEFSKAAAVYSTEVQAPFRLSDLAGSPPRIVLDDPDFPTLASKPMRMTGFTSDAGINRSELRYRG